MLLLLSPRMWEDFGKAGDREICRRSAVGNGCIKRIDGLGSCLRG